MALLLCHECYWWGEPNQGRCPECWHALDASVPDPAPEALGQALGRLLSRVGEIRVNRNALPDRGTLYATTTGLLFLPHEPDRETRMVETGSATESLMWLLASLVWSPLHFLALWTRKRSVTPMHVRVFRPRRLTAADSSRLAEFLMQNPGVFFVPRKSIRSAVRRFNCWRIDRCLGSMLKLRPDSEKHQFHQRFAELLAAERWSVAEHPIRTDSRSRAGIPVRGSAE